MHTILDEVKSILYERQGTYDKPENNFQRIADLWNAYIKSRPEKNDLTPQDVALMMVLMKVAREVYQHKHDNISDGIGYFVCLEQMYAAGTPTE